MAYILNGHIIHCACLGCYGSAYTAACSSSCQYPATLHSHWRGVDQHSTGHNQQPDQLYAKEMCCTAWGKWWSHQILTGFRTPRNNIFERSNYINSARALFLAAEVTRVFLSSTLFPAHTFLILILQTASYTHAYWLTLISGGAEFSDRLGYYTQS